MLGSLGLCSTYYAVHFCYVQCSCRLHRSQPSRNLRDSHGFLCSVPDPDSVIIVPEVEERRAVVSSLRGSFRHFPCPFSAYAFVVSSLYVITTDNSVSMSPLAVSSYSAVYSALQQRVCHNIRVM